VRALGAPLPWSARHGWPAAEPAVLRAPRLLAFFPPPGLDKYGWLLHDGEGFGRQELLDGPFNITLSMVGGQRGGVQHHPALSMLGWLRGMQSSGQSGGACPGLFPPNLALSTR
jgi:hypothetical protein